MNIQPLSDRLLLQRCEKDDIRDAKGNVLVVIPDPIKEDTHFYVVEAIGPKCKLPWRKGQTVQMTTNLHNDFTCVDPKDQVWLAREHLVLPAIFGD